MAVVYGTVLPWHTDPGPAPDPAAPAQNWSEFMRVTPLQAVEWRTLRDEYPDSFLIVAGDLNQSFAAKRNYGNAGTWQLLLEFTDGAHFPQRLMQHPPIDHVCAAAPMGHVLECMDWFGWKAHARQPVGYPTTGEWP